MLYKYNADVVDRSRIDILDEGAIPSASTKSILRLLDAVGHVPALSAICFCWGRNRIDRCNKDYLETDATTLNANDNFAPGEYALAA